VNTTLLKECLDLIFQIQNSRKGYFGTWMGYDARLECDPVDSLASKLLAAAKQQAQEKKP